MSQDPTFSSQSTRSASQAQKLGRRPLPLQVAGIKPDPALIEDLTGLIALIPEPTEISPLWKTTFEALAKFTSGRYPKQLVDRRAAVQKTRLDAEPVKGDKKPPPLAAKRHANFCHGAVQDRDDAEDE